MLDIYNYTWVSSSDVENIIQNKVAPITARSILVHISSYIHNTVLVQNLKKGVEKKLPGAKIVLITSDDKSQTTLSIYTLSQRVADEELENVILNELETSYHTQTDTLNKCREDLLQRYFTDNLTHLPNIYQLRKDLQDADEAGLVVLNIDNFKTINNFYGFPVGDFVIEQVAAYLVEHLKSYKIYRLSVDEFAFVLNTNLGFYELKNFLTTIYENLQTLHVTYQESTIFVDMTMASCTSTNTHDIFSKVSMALKYAKEKGFPFWIYEDRMHFENEYENNLRISALVRHAIETSNVMPYFQSIINNKTMEVKKYECLARLIDQDKNIISPVLFIPIAKKIKIYNLITKTIIDKSFKTFEDNDLEFSINLSIEDIMSTEIFSFIIEKLKTHSASKRVTFELLESEAIQDFQKVERFIYEVKRYGAKIAIDDFGSGYSNFSYLTKMQVDYIKIDGSLIENIDKDKNALLVVETIVAFAQKLGIQTIAEFVHSSPVMGKVKELGIDYSQGYFIDQPTLNI